MTFEQFQSTRTHCDDLGAALNDAIFDADGHKGIGNLYLGCLYIERVQDWWPQAARDHGDWCLLIERDQWISHDLVALERRLYEFALSEGYTVKRAENTYKANDPDFLLDAFIQGWCKAMRVEPDGDVFANLFGGQDEFTESEADTILRAWYEGQRD